MRTVNEKARQAKKIEMMEKCFECYAEYGLTGVGMKTVSDYIGCNVASLYQYFENAGLIVGAKAPIILTSRADSDKTKLNSIALGVLATTKK